MKLAIITPTCRTNPRFAEMARTIFASFRRAPPMTELQWIIVDDRCWSTPAHQRLAEIDEIGRAIPAEVASRIAVSIFAPPPTAFRGPDISDPRPAHNTARNAGLEALDDDVGYVVFLSDCTAVTADWVTLACELASKGLGWKPKIAVVYDYKVPVDKPLTYQNCWDKLHPVRPETVAGACWGVPKEALAAVAGFDTDYDGEDDFYDHEILLRLGRVGVQFVTTKRAGVLRLNRTRLKHEVTTRQETLRAPRNQGYYQLLTMDRDRILPGAARASQEPGRGAAQRPAGAAAPARPALVASPFRPAGAGRARPAPPRAAAPVPAPQPAGLDATLTDFSDPRLRIDPSKPLTWYGLDGQAHVEPELHHQQMMDAGGNPITPPTLHDWVAGMPTIKLAPPIIVPAKTPAELAANRWGLDAFGRPVREVDPNDASPEDAAHLTRSLQERPANYATTQETPVPDAPVPPRPMTLHERAVAARDAKKSAAAAELAGTAPPLAEEARCTYVPTQGGNKGVQCRLKKAHGGGHQYPIDPSKPQPVAAPAAPQPMIPRDPPAPPPAIQAARDLVDDHIAQVVQQLHPLPNDLAKQVVLLAVVLRREGVLATEQTFRVMVASVLRTPLQPETRTGNEIEAEIQETMARVVSICGTLPPLPIAEANFRSLAAYVRVLDHWRQQALLPTRTTMPTFDRGYAAAGDLGVDIQPPDDLRALDDEVANFERVAAAGETEQDIMSVEPISEAESARQRAALQAAQDELDRMVDEGAPEPAAN